MRYLKYLVLIGMLLFPAAAFGAHFSIGVVVGPSYYYAPPPPPVCPYGYYGYYPYACAPYGYYGPEYFVGGAFIGAGPWYRSYYRPRGFYEYRGYYDRGYYGHAFYARPRYSYGRGGFVGHFRGGREFHGGREFRGGREGHGFRGGMRGGFHGRGRR